MKYLITLVFILFLQLCQAQIVYTTKYRGEADLVLYETYTRWQADVILHKEKWQAMADPNKGIWVDTKYRGQSDIVIYWTKYRGEADCIVFFTKHKNMTTQNVCYLSN